MREICFYNFLGDYSKYFILREGNTLLCLIPGSFDDERYWRKVASFLPNQYGVIIPMLPGHAGAGKPMPNSSIQEYAKLIWEILDHYGIEHFFIGGHSIGGMVAIEMLSARCDRILGVIACEGWTHHSVAEKAFHGDVLGELTSKQRRERNQCRRETAIAFTPRQRKEFSKIWTRWNGLPLLLESELPILEVWGDRGLTPRPLLEKMMIPKKKNIKIVWIPDYGHCLPQIAPKLVAQAISDFLSEVISQRADAPTLEKDCHCQS